MLHQLSFHLMSHWDKIMFEMHFYRNVSTWSCKFSYLFVDRSKSRLVAPQKIYRLCAFLLWYFEKKLISAIVYCSRLYGMYLQINFNQLWMFLVGYRPRDHPFKTSANFHDFWPLPPYHRHSSKMLMKGIFDPYVHCKCLQANDR